MNGNPWNPKMEATRAAFNGRGGAGQWGVVPIRLLGRIAVADWRGAGLFSENMQ